MERERLRQPKVYETSILVRCMPSPSCSDADIGSSRPDYALMMQCCIVISTGGTAYAWSSQSELIDTGYSLIGVKLRK